MQLPAAAGRWHVHRRAAQAIAIAAGLFAASAELQACVVDPTVAVEPTNIYSTGFEPPTFSQGALSGQDSWMVTPKNAVATVQTSTVHSGLQALELIDGASFGRAQRSISGTVGQAALISSYAMNIPTGWDTFVDGATDRYEAQARVELADATLGTVGFEFGVIRTPAGYTGTDLTGLQANQTALFIEVTASSDEGSFLHKGYSVLNAGLPSGWHDYLLTIDGGQKTAVLEFDSAPLVTLSLSDMDLVSVSGIQLQNQRWGTNPQQNASLFYDDVEVVNTPEPASLGLLLIAPLLLCKRSRVS